MLRERLKLNKFASKSTELIRVSCNGVLAAWRHETLDALDLPGQPHELRVGKDPTRTP